MVVRAILGLLLTHDVKRQIHRPGCCVDAPSVRQLVDELIDLGVNKRLVGVQCCVMSVSLNSALCYIMEVLPLIENPLSQTLRLRL